MFCEFIWFWLRISQLGSFGLSCSQLGSTCLDWGSTEFSCTQLGPIGPIRTQRAQLGSIRLNQALASEKIRMKMKKASSWNASLCERSKTHIWRVILVSIVLLRAQKYIKGKYWQTDQYLIRDRRKIPASIWFVILEYSTWLQ